MIELTLNAEGNLLPSGSSDVISWFATGNGAGLLHLLQKELPEDCGTSVFFYRQLVRLFAVRLLQFENLREQTDFLRAIPEDEDLKELLFNRPPLPGGEFFSDRFLRKMYEELAAAAFVEWRQCTDDVSSWLASLNPAWGEVGKIAFHLAENRADTDGSHPFLFLITFVHRLGEDDSPRHLPLGNALKLFARERERLAGLLQVIQKAAGCCPLIARLSTGDQIFRPVPLSAADVYGFLQCTEQIQECGIVVRMVNLWKRKPAKLQLEITVDTSGSRGELSPESLLNFKVEAVLGGVPLSKEELEKLLASAGGLVRFKEKWVEADTGKIQKLLTIWQQAARFSQSTGLSFTSGMRLLAGIASGGGVPAPDAQLCNFSAGENLQRILEGGGGIAPLPVLPQYLADILRPYQLDGVRFLWRMNTIGMGVCLADDMGLGKTLQVLTYAELLRRQNVFLQRPGILVLPASLLNNWRQEAEKFTPDLRFKVLHPSFLAQDEIQRFREDASRLISGYDLVATTYAMLTRMPQLNDLEFPLAIVDEAQAIKSAHSRQSRAVRSLKARRRIALTGTPIENRLSDLWSIYDFLNPGLLGSAADFQEQCREMAVENRYGALRKLIAPTILRRLKSDRSIISDLPDKVEKNCYCTLSKQQAALYLSVLSEMRNELAAAEGMARKGVVLKYLTGFKQICDHPDLYRGGTRFAVEESGKFLKLGELAERIASRGEKLLVFTQFREMTGPLFDLLAQKFSRPGLILHGGTPVGERAGLVRDFQREGGAPFFVLSLKAAGTGLNLTAASHVIHFDRWWNPAVENQATDRAYRIGQHQNVMVHKFLCGGTIESRIDWMLHRKTSLADSLLAPGEGEVALTELNDAELLELVKLEAWTENGTL